MKRAGYSLLFIAFMSCGTGSQLTGNRIRIFFRDSTVSDYELLFVRDTAIVIESQTDRIPFVISFSRIDCIYHSASGKIWGGIAGCAAGGMAGALTGSLLTISSGGTSGSHHEDYSGLFVVGLIGVCAIVGTPIGCAIAHDELAFYPESSVHDRNRLSDFAKYPYIEPTGLKDLK